jgi:type IV secretory pathway VirB2 component (pilin)
MHTKWNYSIDPLMLYRCALAGILAIAIYLGIGDVAYADGPGFQPACAILAKGSGADAGGCQGNIGCIACELTGCLIFSGLAQAIATLGIIMVGVAASFGKVSWTMAIVVAIGISVIFGTATIINYIASGEGACIGQ